jgi:hypothetical protein
MPVDLLERRGFDLSKAAEIGPADIGNHLSQMFWNTFAETPAAIERLSERNQISEDYHVELGGLPRQWRRDNLNGTQLRAVDQQDGTVRADPGAAESRNFEFLQACVRRAPGLKSERGR